MTLSTVSASQMPRSTSEIASRHSACCSRLPMKPGTSFFTCAGILPASACSFMVKSIAAGEVHCVPITSTSGTRNGGFHQCVPSARSRSLQALHDLGDRHHRGVAGEDGVGPDVLLDLGEDLLLQRHVFEHRLDHVVGVAHAVGHDRRPAARARPPSRRRRGRAGWSRCAASRVSRLGLCESVMVTSWPASANTCAMPWPIRPAPMTAMRAFAVMRQPAV